MATVYHKPNSPYWFAQFTNAEGKRVSRSTKCTKKKEARKIAEDYESAERTRKKESAHLPKAFAEIVRAAAKDAEAGQLTLARSEELVRRLHSISNPDFEVVSLQDHLAKWEKAQRSHVSAKSARTYADMVRRVTAALGPKKSSSPLSNLTREDVESALVRITNTQIKCSGRKISATTANMDLRALRRALEVAVEDGLVKSNVAKAVRPLPEHDKIERAPFTRSEVKTMINHPDTPAEWKGVILLAAHTGLRLGDVVRLTGKNVDGTTLQVRPEKTKKSQKTLTVPLSPPCLAWIADKEGKFFPTLSRLPVGTLSTQFVRIMERCEIPREIVEAGNVTKRRSFHSLRHSFASWLAEADIHADVRQRLTGHQSPGVHARYTHHDQSLKKAIRTLPKLWDSSGH